MVDFIRISRKAAMVAAIVMIAAAIAAPPALAQALYGAIVGTPRPTPTGITRSGTSRRALTTWRLRFRDSRT